MTTSDNIAPIDPPAEVHIVWEIGPEGDLLLRKWSTFMTFDGSVSYSSSQAEARKAEAMEREIAALRAILAGDHELKPLSEERLDEILEFEEQFKMLGGAGDTASLDWATQRALIDEAVLACRARTLLNGGSDAQE